MLGVGCYHDAGLDNMTYMPRNKGGYSIVLCMVHGKQIMTKLVSF